MSLHEAHHPTIAAAAEGRLPGWAAVSDDRFAHLNRVAELLDSWASALELDARERERWRAGGYLHDALRDADPAGLRARLPPSLARLPDLVLHGPAAAERLRIDGVMDGELLHAVAYHTIGHPGFGTLGRALYAADFLEPGRTFEVEWREALRARMPDELDSVVREILAGRIRYLVGGGIDLLLPTVDFWNALVGQTR